MYYELPYLPFPPSPFSLPPSTCFFSPSPRPSPASPRPSPASPRPSPASPRPSPASPSPPPPFTHSQQVPLFPLPAAAANAAVPLPPCAAPPACCPHVCCPSPCAAPLRAAPLRAAPLRAAPPECPFSATASADVAKCTASSLPHLIPLSVPSVPQCSPHPQHSRQRRLHAAIQPGEIHPLLSSSPYPFVRSFLSPTFPSPSPQSTSAFPATASAGC
ncbi:unnamed protein product [Closterium sp. Naga37s-1]|nr:unnamed protein product [Closterium sp. Naga37s-1]